MWSSDGRSLQRRGGVMVMVRLENLIMRRVTGSPDRLRQKDDLKERIC